VRLTLAFCCFTLIAAEKPLAVLQEAGRRLESEPGRAALAEAIEAAPDHAVFTIRNSPAVREFAAPRFPALMEVASLEGVRDFVLARLAVLCTRASCAESRALAANYPAYFAKLISLRIAKPDAVLDRVLHEQAEFIRSAWVEGGASRAALGLAKFAPRDLYAVLAYGQREESEHTYAKFFDGEVAPRLGKRLGSAIETSGRLRLREFLVEGIRAKRVAAVAGLLAPEWFGRSLEGIATIEQAALAAELIEAYAGAGAVKMRAALASEHSKGGAYAGLLAAWLQRVAPATGFRIAGEYAKYLPVAEALGPQDLCAGERCLQRYIFFDDEDGVSSFAGFSAQYGSDTRWKWEDHGSYVRVSRNGVEIYANRPQTGSGTVSEAWDDTSKAPQRALSEVLAARGVPRVFVQRGHAYHVEKSIEFIPAEARLVFLGSCRGTIALQPIIERAHAAQIIATRSTGTASINDPLLKAINDRLADGASIDWAQFWGEQNQRFSSRSYFDSYIPPHRNGPANFLHGWRNLQAAR